MRISDWSSDVCSSDLLIDAADHVEGGFGQVIIVAVDHRLERADRVFDRDELAGDAGEHLGDVERLRKKALNLASARNRQLILFRQFVHAENGDAVLRSEEHTSELQSLMRISYAVFCLNKKIY